PVPHADVLEVALELDTLSVQLRVSRRERQPTVLGLDDGWRIAGKRSRRRADRGEEREQVGHVLLRQVLLQSLGHERLARTAQLLDVGPEKRLVLALLAAEDDRGRGLAGEDAGHGPLPLRDRLVLDVARVEVAVRVEDLLEQVRGGAVGERRE